MILLNAVLDTNVLVSALLASGAKSSMPAQLVEQAFFGKLVPVYSHKIVEEYYEVLFRKKFGFDIDLVMVFLDELQKRGYLIEPVHCGESFPDPDDAVFYETMYARSLQEICFLVTGNLKHYPDNPSVVSSRQIVELLNVTSQL